MPLSPRGATLLASLVQGWEQTGDLSHDVSTFLVKHGYPQTAVHVADVAAEARRLAARFGEDTDRAGMAGWLHDISAVIPSTKRVAAAEACGLAVLPEECVFPMIVHQRLSAAIARALFGVRDEATLSAIACHTTLKPAASCLDTLVFVADKIAWDQPGTPPYHADLIAALDHSLDAAAFVYLDWLWGRRVTLGVIHPWFRAAYMERSPETRCT